MGSREKGHRFLYISAKNNSRLKVTLQSEEDSEHYTLRSLEVVKDNFLHPLQLSNLIFLILCNLQMAKVVHGEESPREVLQIQVGNA